MHTPSKSLSLVAVSLVLAASLAPAVVADDAAVKGTWKVSFEMQGQPVEATLEIKDAEGGGLTGTWSGPRGTATLQDVKWDGTQLSFSRTADRENRQFTIQHTAQISGDTIEGKMVLPQREITFTGKKAS